MRVKPFWRRGFLSYCVLLHTLVGLIYNSVPLGVISTSYCVGNYPMDTSVSGFASHLNTRFIVSFQC